MRVKERVRESVCVVAPISRLRACVSTLEEWELIEGLWARTQGNPCTALTSARLSNAKRKWEKEETGMIDIWRRQVLSLQAPRPMDYCVDENLDTSRRTRKRATR